MPKRTYWTKINLDDARDAIQMMDDAEVGRWFRGWVAGASGKSFQEKLASWPVEMRSGYSAGIVSFEDSKAYSEKQRQRVAARYQTPTETLPDATAVAFGSENATGMLPANSQQLTANS